MQRVVILRDVKYLTANTISSGVVVTTSDEYYSNSQTTQGQVVNPTNVRAFLEDERNQVVIDGFLGYLSGSSLMNTQAGTDLFVSTPYFREIFYDDEKLSTVFNEYYNQTVLLGNNLDDSTLTKETTNIPLSSGLTYVIDTASENLFQWVSSGNMSIKHMDYIPREMVNNQRFYEYRDEYVPISLEDNYYINIEIKKNWAPVAQQIPDLKCESIFEIEDIGLENTGGQYGGLDIYGVSSGYGGGYTSEYYSFFGGASETTSDFFLAELFTTKKYYEHSVILDLANFAKINNFLISGSFALSKQGTVYRKGYNDLDIIKYSATPQYTDISNLGIVLLGFSINEYGIVTVETSEFVNMFPEGYVTRVQKLNSYSIGDVIANDGYRVYIGEFPVNVYSIYEPALYDIVPGEGIATYKSIFLIKSTMGREKDLNDIRLFKKYETIKSFEKDMYINASNSIIQCFVDLNDQEKSDDIWTSPIRKIAFEFSEYVVKEGDILSINIDLNKPALGNEEVDVVFNTLPGYSHSVDLSEDVSGISTQTVSFSQGEIRKTITITANRDLLYEYSELLIVDFENLVNTSKGEFDRAQISVIDTTEKRTVAFVQDSGVAETIQIEVMRDLSVGFELLNVPIYNYYIDEPAPDGTALTTSYQVRFKLDEPSTYNNEEIHFYISKELRFIPQVYTSSVDTYNSFNGSGEYSAVADSLVVSPGFNPYAGGGSTSTKKYLVKWESGEQIKKASFEIGKDLNINEPEEVFYMFLSDVENPWVGVPRSSVEFGVPRLARIIVRNRMPENYVQKYSTYDFQDVYIGIAKDNATKTSLFYDNDPGTVDARSFFKNWNASPVGSAVYDPSEPITTQGMLGTASTRLRIKNTGDASVVLNSGFTENFSLGVGEIIDILQTQLESGTFDNLKLTLPANSDWTTLGTISSYYNKSKYEISLVYFFHPYSDNLDFRIHSTSSTLNIIKLNNGNEIKSDTYEYDESIINRQYAVSFTYITYNNFASSEACSDKCKLTMNTSIHSGGLINISNGVLIPYGQSRLAKCKFINYPIDIDSIAGCSGCTSGTTLDIGETADSVILEDRLIPFISQMYEYYIYLPPVNNTDSVILHLRNIWTQRGETTDIAKCTVDNTSGDDYTDEFFAWTNSNYVPTSNTSLFIKNKGVSAITLTINSIDYIVDINGDMEFYESEIGSFKDLTIISTTNANLGLTCAIDIALKQVKLKRVASESIYMDYVLNAGNEFEAGYDYYVYTKVDNINVNSRTIFSTEGNYEEYDCSSILFNKPASIYVSGIMCTDSDVTSVDYIGWNKNSERGTDCTHDYLSAIWYSII